MSTALSSTTRSKPLYGNSTDSHDGFRLDNLPPGAEPSSCRSLVSSMV